MRILGGVLAAVLGASTLLAQSADVPLHNWTVPPFARTSAGGITTMTDVTPPRTFIGVQPCRVADTRGNGAPIQGGIFPNSGLRTWDVTGICGLPAGTDAISVNFTVVPAPAAPSGAFLLAWPTGQAPPPTAIMTYGPGTTIISNAAIVPLGPGEQLNVNVSHSTHIIMDVNGYFSDTTAGTSPLELIVNQHAFVAEFENLSTDCFGPCGISSTIHGVGGAILGFAAFNASVHYGVAGSVQMPSAADSAGVWGGAGMGAYFGGYGATGVRGQGQINGVLGLGTYSGVAGDLINGESAPFTILARGILGFDSAGIKYGVFAQSNMGGTGAKFFVEPHPTDASKVIRYVSLEGPEAGTYFRGRGKFQGGIAHIAVPEDFRMVTDAEGLSVQVTPIGAMASFAVMKADLDEIVVQSSRNVEFYYLVHGVRRTHKHLTPIGDGSEYRPDRPDARMPAYLTEPQKQLLVQNGTYSPDGSVNMETARRLGWDRIWAERERPRSQPSE